MKRCQRASFTSCGTGSRPRSLERAPSTGSYLKQPTRSIFASSSQSSRISKSSSVSPGKPTMKVERMARSGQTSRQPRMRSSVFSPCAGPAHGLQHRRRGVLEGDVEIGQDLALGHQRDDLVDMRVGVDVVHAAPRCPARRVPATGRGTSPATSRSCHRLRLVLDVDAVGAGVLRDDEQFLDAGLGQLFGLAQHVAGRARDEVAAQRRDDAEGAAVVAALGNLQIGVVARRQLDALRRHADR